jgi:hypothetical protein
MARGQAVPKKARKAFEAHVDSLKAQLSRIGQIVAEAGPQ